MMNTLRLYPTQEDKERLNALLQEIGTIIARSNTNGLELDWDHFAEAHFSKATGYGQFSEGGGKLPLPFMDFIEGLDIEG